MRTAEELQVCVRLVRRARQPRDDQGILPDVASKLGKPLNQAVIDRVIAFYNVDRISRVMPGKEDFKRVKEDGKRVLKQKRLILMNLNEAYETSKDKYPDDQIGISKFCSLKTQ